MTYIKHSAQDYLNLVNFNTDNILMSIDRVAN